MRIKIHNEDKENPMVEFVSSKGTSGAISLRVLAEQYEGRIIGKTLRECLDDLRQNTLNGEINI